MIHVNRPAEPSFFLSERLLRARKEVTELYQINTQERFRFNTKLLQEIKPLLNDVFNNKCAYCESKVGATSYGEIDHFRPKSGSRGIKGEFSTVHYFWLAYEWQNLYLSCQMCNFKYKRDLFPVADDKNRAPVFATGNELLSENALLIDPCFDQPEEHLLFSADGTVKGVTEKGTVTIEILGLNRSELAHQRKLVADQLTEKLSRLKTRSKNTHDILGHINDLFSDNTTIEYAAMQRQVFNLWRKANEAAWTMLTSYGTLSVKSDIEKSLMTHLVLNAGNVSQIQKNIASLKRFTIKSIEIKNFKAIQHLQLHIPPALTDSPEPRECWLLLLGDNGIGKSSILQAVAIALAGKKKLEQLKLKPAEYIRHGTKEGHIIIHCFEQEEPIKVSFNEQLFITSLKEPPTFLLAYGSIRLLPKGKLKPFESKDPLINIQNLFDYSHSLIDANQWLTSLDPKDFETRVAPALFDLLDLQKNDRVSLGKKQLELCRGSQQHGLEHISDGYKSMIALACDIMKTLSTDQANYHSSSGIVLIDELGNHLHPRWRMKIVSALRKAFPKLQFIVTTHEPLCLRGLSHGEVNVLVTDHNKNILALGKEMLPDHNLLRVDQLLTSDLFGLINTFDIETEKSFREYYELLVIPQQRRTDVQKKHIAQFTERFSKNEFFASTPQMQAVYQLVNEQFAQNVRNNDFKTKQELQDSTVKAVKSIINKEDLDWLKLND